MNPYLAMATVSGVCLGILILSQHGIGGAFRWIGIKLIITGERAIDFGAAFDAACKHGAELFRTYQRRRMGEQA